MSRENVRFDIEISQNLQTLNDEFISSEWVNLRILQLNDDVLSGCDTKNTSRFQFHELPAESETEVIQPIPPQTPTPSQPSRIYSSLTEREKLSWMAALAESAERYEDMKNYVIQMAHTITGFTLEERNLFSICYKNLIGPKRDALRTIKEKKNEQNISKNLILLENFEKEIVREMIVICEEVLDLIGNLLCRETNIESKVFFLKMKADYLRFWAEADENEDVIKKGAEAYEIAYTMAENHLHATNAIYLGLQLNYGVFAREILKDVKKAREISKRAFDRSISELDCLEEDGYKDSTLIMQLLRDNLTDWAGEESEEESEDQMREEEMARREAERNMRREQEEIMRREEERRRQEEESIRGAIEGEARLREEEIERMRIEEMAMREEMEREKRMHEEECRRFEHIEEQEDETMRRKKEEEETAMREAMEEEEKKRREAERMNENEKEKEKEKGKEEEKEKEKEQEKEKEKEKEKQEKGKNSTYDSVVENMKVGKMGKGGIAPEIAGENVRLKFFKKKTWVVDLGVADFFVPNLVGVVEEDKKLEKIEKYESEECVVCLENKADLTMMPCRHQACCYFCVVDGKGDSQGLNIGQCPLCRQPVSFVFHQKK